MWDLRDTMKLSVSAAAMRGRNAWPQVAFLRKPPLVGGAAIVIPEDMDLDDQPVTPNAARLWTGGIATAVVAALIVVAGVFIARGVLNISVLAPKRASDLGNSSTAVYAGLAAAATLVATALLHVLLLGAPRPITFFVWIAALADLVAAAAPFTQSAPTSSKVFTSILNLIVGFAVISLLSGVAASAIRAGRRTSSGTASGVGRR